MAKKLREAGVHAEVIEAPDKTHGTLNQDLGKAGDKVTEKLLERLEMMQEKAHRPPPGSDKSADQWIRAIRRRAEEMRQGTAKTVSLDEAVEEAKRRIR